MFICTERLFLRPGWPEDLDALNEALREESSEHADAGLPLSHSPAALRELLVRPGHPLLPHFFIFLRDRAGARLVGAIGLARHGGAVELGYWIVPSQRGRGFALEALRAVVEQARTLGHRRLVARHVVDSPEAARVMEAAGFLASGGEGMRGRAGRGEGPTARLFALDLERRAPIQTMRSEQALSA